MALPLPRAFTSAFAAERATVASRRNPRTPLLARAGRLAARLLPTLAVIRTLVLSVAGLGALTAAAWLVAVPLGLAAAGLALLVLEWLTGGDT